MATWFLCLLNSLKWWWVFLCLLMIICFLSPQTTWTVERLSSLKVPEKKDGFLPPGRLLWMSWQIQASPFPVVGKEDVLALCVPWHGTHTASLYYLMHPCHQLRQYSLEQHTPTSRYSSEGPITAPFKELWNPPSLPQFIRMEKHCLCWSLSPCLNQTVNITSNFRVASNYFTPWRELSYKEYHRLGLS